MGRVSTKICTTCILGHPDREGKHRSNRQSRLRNSKEVEGRKKEERRHLSKVEWLKLVQ
jgi:hypothetical protein